MDRDAPAAAKALGATLKAARLLTSDNMFIFFALLVITFFYGAVNL